MARPERAVATWLPDARVVLLTREGCHLCDTARATILDVLADIDAKGADAEHSQRTDPSAVPRLAEVDVDEIADLADPADLARYAEQLPVTFVDGRQHDYWRVDPARLRAALERPPRRRRG